MVTAVQTALHDFLDDRPEEAILLLEAALIFSQEPVEVMEQHPVEDGALGMSRTITSGHRRSFSSRKGPGRSTLTLRLEEAPGDPAFLLWRVNRS